MDDPPCYIDKLPSELLYSITEHLEDKDKRALRLMNKKLCAVASKGFCFESVTISPSNESIYQLISVATCDFWRTQVKHIDWVLLAGDPKSGLQAQLVEFQQDTKFNQDVVKRYLKPLDGNTDNSSSTYYLLAAQCDMVLRLTNLKSIQFHFSKAFPTGQLKKSEGHDMISSNKIARYDETSMKPMPDVFSTLSSLKLGSQGVRPDAVRSLYASMFSEYSADGDCHHFCIHGCDSDHSPPSKRSIAAIESPWNYWSYDLSTVKSLSHNSFSTLRGVAITALVVSADDIETIVRNCPLLNDLALNHLRLRGSQGDGPLVQLLQFLRSHYEKGHLSDPKLNIQFVQLECLEFLGPPFSACSHVMMDWLKGDDETLLADAKLYATFKATANHIADGLMSGSHGHGCENHSDDEDNEDEDDEDYEDDDEDDDEDNDEDNDEEFGSDDLADLEEDMFYAFLDSFQDHFEGMYGNHGESESSDHDEDDDSLPDLIPMASEEDNDDILPDLVPIGTKEPTQATKTIPATKPKTAEQANTEKCGNQSTKHTIGSDTKAGNQEELDGDPYGFAFSDCEDDEWDGED